MGLREILDNIFRRKMPLANNLDIESNLELGFMELEDDRVWYEIDTMRKIHELSESGDLHQALHLAYEDLPKYPDFYYLYCKIGSLLDKMGRSAEAHQVRLQGLQRSRSRANICFDLGNRAFEDRNFKEAVDWWLKSCQLQLTSGRFVDGYSFLNLAYIAQGLGLKGCYEWLLTLADKVKYVRFDADAADLRLKVANHGDAGHIERGISALHKKYS